MSKTAKAITIVIIGLSAIVFSQYSLQNNYVDVAGTMLEVGGISSIIYTVRVILLKKQEKVILGLSVGLMVISIVLYRASILNYVVGSTALIVSGIILTITGLVYGLYQPKKSNPISIAKYDPASTIVLVKPSGQTIVIDINDID